VLKFFEGRTGLCVVSREKKKKKKKGSGMIYMKEVATAVIDEIVVKVIRSTKLSEACFWIEHSFSGKRQPTLENQSSYDGHDEDIGICIVDI
jgi:hypothetical protein